jgi:hypothetical protein
MPRLFTALELPDALVGQLALVRCGIVGARWLEPDDYHITLRFIGDVDGSVALGYRRLEIGHYGDGGCCQSNCNSPPVFKAERLSRRTAECVAEESPYIPADAPHVAVVGVCAQSVCVALAFGIRPDARTCAKQGKQRRRMLRAGPCGSAGRMMARDLGAVAEVLGPSIRGQGRNGKSDNGRACDANDN